MAKFMVLMILCISIVYEFTPCGAGRECVPLLFETESMV